jgi:hypothetical protein
MRDSALRRGLLQGELEQNYQLEVKLKLQELQLMQRRKEITNQLMTGEYVEPPALNML